ncbi:MAG TPA: hypothetical protein VG276_27790 [Actinomycetes bacterium]|jgi:hypothetical protein|nr:hypothetical protein [Actinomycetes bacterium]
MDTPSRRPEPLRARALIVATAAAAIHILAVKGWIPALSDNSEQAAAAGVVDVVGALATWWLARSHVTPTSDPRSSDGKRLVVAGSESPPAASRIAEQQPPRPKRGGYSSGATRASDLPPPPPDPGKPSP